MRGAKEITTPVYITETATVAGPKESKGDLGTTFDVCMPDNMWNEKSWESAESKMQQQAIQTLLLKSTRTADDIDLMLAGDLLAQCIGTNFGIREFGIPFLGQFGACSTMAQTLATGAMAINAGMAENAICGTSSHFYSAERQFRFPIEYGGQRTPTAQWTVTGAGFALLSREPNNENTQALNVRVTSVTIGKIVDGGIKDAANMGAAMAPAAADTLAAHFDSTKTVPQDYSMIITGDLGSFGGDILLDLMDKSGFDMRDNYRDCGTVIFDLVREDVHCGASGCGCSALAMCGLFLPMIARGELKRVLFVGTGALMSLTSFQQGESIPSIAHAVELQL
ncbi:MAG: stage V sporulation protein AD [Clostridiales bacterium]|jgi:stage V sporulation protein AD|nr:stage V sporulation protein AD [Clostridiales bacterium]